MKISDTYPGINSSAFVWSDADKNVHQMEDMNLFYLKNVRNALGNMEMFTNADDYEELMQKIKELDKAIAIVKRECIKAKISPSLAEKSCARDFGIHSLLNE